MDRQRRTLLQALAATVGSAATLALPAAHARPARAADFHRAVAADPLLRPFAGVADAPEGLASDNPLLRGRWPAELRGRLHRNGPALYERGGERYHHWFDGDGMVQQFAIEGGRVRHRGRLVQTAKLRAERAAGRFALPAFGTTVENPLPLSGADSVNPANTSVLEHGGRLLALWEGGSAHELDAADLSTRGPVTWRDDLKGLPFSAHPKVGADGTLWNIGTAGAHLVVWQIGADGRLQRAQLGAHPYPHGMVHDFAITDRWLVVPLPPVRFAFDNEAREGPRRFPMDAGQPLRVLIARKDDLARQRVLELPPQFVFHVGNAHEERDGTVVLGYVGAPDNAFLDCGAVALMRGERPLPAPAGTCIARLDPVRGTARVQQLDDAVEFPRVHPACVGRRARWLVSACGAPRGSAGTNALLRGVQVLDTETGRVQRFDYGEQAIAEEHIVVPRPGRSGERDAWLLGTVYDARRDATVLNLLDLARVEDGPLAQAVLPYRLPLGFHGHFRAT